MKKLILFLLLTSITFGQNMLLLMGDDNPETLYAIDLNGTDEYMQDTSPSDLDLSEKPYTIIAWVKTPNPIDGASKRTIISTDANPTRGWVFHLTETEDWAMWVDASTGAQVEADTTITTPDQWELIIFSCTDGVHEYRTYIDGVRVIEAESAPGSVTLSGNTKLTVGMDGYPQNFYYKSQLGQIQVVSGYALTQGEIIALYNAGGMLNASYGGGTVVAWYKWQGSTDADMLKDWSASGNNLTGTNVTTADQVKIGMSYK